MPRLSVAARLHLSDLNRRVTPATLRQRRYDLEAFTLHIGGDTNIRAIKQKHIEEWVRAQDCAPSTLKLRFLSVRALFNFAVSKGWIRRSPAEEVVIPRIPRRQPRALSLEDFQAISRVVPDARASLILSLAVNEGLRRVEITRLELGDIDTTDMTLRVVTAKSQSEDIVPLTQFTADRLAKYLTVRGTRPGPLIQSYTTGAALTPATLGKMVAKWMSDAGVKGAAFDGKSLHACRHTTAMNLLDHGADPQMIQQALRHASLASTWAYLRTQRNVELLRPYMGLPMKEAG